MFAKGQTIIQLFEQLAPKHYAMSDDKIGLQVGTLNKQVRKVMLTLDVLENVVDEAIEKEVDLIIAHHAVIFKPIKNLRTDLAQGRVYEKLLKNDIAVYIAHTNLDVAPNGVNDVLAGILGLEHAEILQPIYTEQMKKLVVFVPETHQQHMIDTLSTNGAGWIGNYSHTTFNTSGIGTFMPQKGTDPYIGTQGVLEKVDEVRLETIVTEEKQNKIVQAMIKAHPYEEVAYDIYPLEQKGNSYGIGRIGNLPESIPLEELAKEVKSKLKMDGVRVIGDLNSSVQKVAIVGGDGNSFVSKAAFKGADVLVTGDIYYHVAHEAMAQGLSIIDAGHYIEKHVLYSVKEYLFQRLLNKYEKTEIIISETNTNPFQFI